MQLYNLRQAVLAMATALGAALPPTADVVASLAVLMAATPPCKHCHLQLVLRGTDYVHAEGPQTGMGTCAKEPYGYHAEPIGQPCSAHPANPCNGARHTGPTTARSL